MSVCRRVRPCTRGGGSPAPSPPIWGSAEPSGMTARSAASGWVSGSGCWWESVTAPMLTPWYRRRSISRRWPPDRPGPLGHARTRSRWRSPLSSRNCRGPRPRKSRGPVLAAVRGPRRLPRWTSPAYSPDSPRSPGRRCACTRGAAGQGRRTVLWAARCCGRAGGVASVHAAPREQLGAGYGAAGDHLMGTGRSLGPR